MSDSLETALARLDAAFRKMTARKQAERTRRHYQRSSLRVVYRSPYCDDTLDDAVSNPPQGDCDEIPLQTPRRL